MQHAESLRNSLEPRKEVSPVPGLILMGVALCVALFGSIAVSGTLDNFPYLFLLPWIAGLALVLTIPSAVMFYQGKFSFADPLIFATWSYFFPAFVVGGIFLALGWSQPYFLYFIQDAKVNLPYTIFLVGLGFAGLSIGYFLPIGSKLGSIVAEILPGENISLRSYAIPGTILLLLGIINTIAAFALGMFGYQTSRDLNSYDGLVFLTTLFWTEASFLLWYLIFREKKLSLVYLPIIIVLISTSLSKVLFSGSRSAILQVFLLMALAYILSGRKFKFKQSLITSVMLTAGLILGMIYGTNFRLVKGNESKQSAEQYTENILETLDRVGQKDIYDNLEFSFSSLTERVDIVSTLAVVVSNYQQLKPFEEAYGLDNNIWVDLTTFFVPRVVWKDKPSASDPRRYSELYFNFGGSSFAITPIGDLLRNYGVVGVPIGMLILGIILRFIYCALVDGQKRSVWRLTLYCMILLTVSYEGFYGPLIPSIVKSGLMAIVGLVIVRMLARLFGSGQPAAKIS